MKYLLLMLSVLSIQSCKQSRESIKTEYIPKYEEIYWGNIGGFSGVDNYFRITPKGEIYECQSDKKDELVGEFHETMWKEIEQDVDRLLKMDEDSGYTSGMVHHYVKFIIKGEEQTITWVLPDTEFTEEAQKLYNKLSKLKTKKDKNPTY